MSAIPTYFTALHRTLSPHPTSSPAGRSSSTSEARKCYRGRRPGRAEVIDSRVSSREPRCSTALYALSTAGAAGFTGSTGKGLRLSGP